MRFVTIEPAAHLITFIDSPSVEAALRTAGLNSDVDHGFLSKTVGIFIDEFGMFAEPDHQDYFAIDGHLFAGPALLYAFDQQGETKDMPNTRLEPAFLHGREEVEAAIANEKVTRPQMLVNGDVIWQWPQPAPFA